MVLFIIGEIKKLPQRNPKIWFGKAMNFRSAQWLTSILSSCLYTSLLVIEMCFSVLGCLKYCMIRMMHLNRGVHR